VEINPAADPASFHVCSYGRGGQECCATISCPTWYFFPLCKITNACWRSPSP